MKVLVIFTFQKKKRTTKGKLLYPSLQITFPKKDFPFISVQSTLFNSCSIITKPGRQFYIQTIGSRNDIIKIYNQFNGNIKTSTKYDQFHNLYLYLRKDADLIEDLKPINNQNQNDNSWLAGFIEADGFFYIRTTKNAADRIRISFEFSICKHDADHPIQREIADLLGVSVRDIIKKKQKRVTTTSFSSVEKLFIYLDKHPLYGSKWNDYIDFKEGYNLYRNKSDSNTNQKEKRENLQKQKNNMNRYRTFFQWKHIIQLTQQIENYKIKSEL